MSYLEPKSADDPDLDELMERGMSLSEALQVWAANREREATQPTQH